MSMTSLVLRASPSVYSIIWLVFREGCKTIIDTATSEAARFVARDPLLGMAAAGGVYNFRQGNYCIGSALSLMPSLALTLKISSIVSSFLGLESETEGNGSNPFFSSQSHRVGGSETERICPFKIEEFEKCTELQEEAKQLALTCKAPSRAYNQSRQFRLLKNKGLYSNLQAAQEILKDTLDAVPFSPNYMARSWKILEERAKTQGVSLKDLPELDLSCLLKPIFGCFQFISFYPESPLVARDFFSQRKIRAITSSKMSMGNCQEMASVALFKGMERGAWNTRLDIVGIGNGNHEFLVMGMESPNSAVVIDAWANEVYPLVDIEARLHDHVNTDFKTGKPELKQMDFSSQSLEIRERNIYFMEDLVALKSKIVMSNDQIGIYDLVMQCMNRFHQTEDLDIKLIHAKEVSELCAQSSMDSLHYMRTLKAQVEHFIELSYQWP